MKAGVSVQRQVRAAAKSVAMERLRCKCRDRHIVCNFVEQGSAMDVFRRMFRGKVLEWVCFASLITIVSHVEVVAVPQQFLEIELKAQ